MILCWSVFAADQDPPLNAREQKLLERIGTLEQRPAASEMRLCATSPAAAPGANLVQTASAEAPAASPAAALEGKPATTTEGARPCVLGATATGAAAAAPAQGSAAEADQTVSTDALKRTADDPQAPSGGPTAQPSDPGWQYGGFADIGYLHDFNYPSNHLFRSRGTTFHVNEVDLNMAGLYLRKPTSESSRWGTELTLQAGKDSEVFGFSASAPNLAGSKWLRHLGPTDVSYLAPIGKGLTFQGGIFSSFIGYDSLYAKDNFTYTRPWGADFTPYLMLGVNAQYPFTGRLTGTLFLISGYWHLAHANNVPSSGGQLAYKATDHVTLKQTVLYGPHQSDTSPQFWRFLSDSIAEWKRERLTTAFEYIAGTEKIAAPGNVRALWMTVQVPVHWVVNRRFSITVRPEVYWDRDGRTTGFQQTVKSNTTTLEYRIPLRQASAILRLEHRIDDSRGPGGGFFNDGDVRPEVVGLTPTQNLLTLGVILTFASSFHFHHYEPKQPLNVNYWLVNGAHQSEDFNANKSQAVLLTFKPAKTLSWNVNFTEGLLMRTEWRRDFSNRPFFLTTSPDVLKHEQTTATLGLIWWFGGKQGAW